MTRDRIVQAFPPVRALLSTWAGSSLFTFAAFLARHRRMPRFARSGLFNDFLFESKLKETDYVLRSFTADKEFMKAYVKGITGEDLVIPTIAILRSIEEADAFAFPPNCVVKPTHMSGQVVLVGPDAAVPPPARDRIRRWFGQNYGTMTGERHYQRLVPKVIVEPWLKLNGDRLFDYKIHVFRGQPRLVEINFGGPNRAPIGYFCAIDWTPVNLGSIDYAEPTPEDCAEAGFSIENHEPECLRRIMNIAQLLGSAFEYVRVDFYTDGKDRIYVGELSHIAANARERFRDPTSERAFLQGPHAPSDEQASRRRS